MNDVCLLNNIYIQILEFDWVFSFTYLKFSHQTCVVNIMNYPNGKPYSKNKSSDGRKPSPFSSNIEYGGRGMSLEKDIEQSNTFYLKSGIAVIHKKPTPRSDSQCSLS